MTCIGRLPSIRFAPGIDVPVKHLEFPDGGLCAQKTNGNEMLLEVSKEVRGPHFYFIFAARAVNHFTMAARAVNVGIEPPLLEGFTAHSDQICKAFPRLKQGKRKRDTLEDKRLRGIVSFAMGSRVSRI